MLAAVLFLGLQLDLGAEVVRLPACQLLPALLELPGLLLGPVGVPGRPLDYRGLPMPGVSRLVFQDSSIVRVGCRTYTVPGPWGLYGARPVRGGQ